MRDRGHQQSGESDVDAVDGAAIHLGGDVEPLHRLADVAPLLARLQLDNGRHGQCGGYFDQLPPGDLAPRAGMHDLAAGNGAGSGRNAPALRGCLDQQGARRGAGRAQSREHSADRTAAAGLIRLPHAVVGAFNGRHLDAHALPVELELIGENLRQPCLCALTHFRGVGQQCDVAVPVDTHPAAELRRLLAGTRRCRGSGAERNSDQQCAADAGADAQAVAPRDSLVE